MRNLSSNHPTLNQHLVVVVEIPIERVYYVIQSMKDNTYKIKKTS